MTTGKKILAVVLSIVLVLVGCGVVYVFGIRASIAGDSIDENNLSTAKLPKGIVNYALFGVDARAGVDGDRSDTIMIISVNYKSGKITTTSIQRDTMARIPKSKKNDETFTKINAAYSYGGPQLALKTLNQNFDLNITDYVTVGFEGMQQLVDTLGGVTVNITDDKVVKYTNKYIDESVPDHSQDVKLGKNHLNGLQALCYSRNRYSDSDFGRAQRQREIFKKIFKKLSKANTMTLLNTASKIYPYIKTSMSMNEISSLISGYMKMDNKKMSDGAIPIEGAYAYKAINGQDTTIPNTLRSNAIALHQAIYGKDVDYTPSATVNEISDAIVSRTGIGTYSGSAPSSSTATTTDNTTNSNTGSTGTTNTYNNSSSSTSSNASASSSSRSRTHNQTSGGYKSNGNPPNQESNAKTNDNELKNTPRNQPPATEPEAENPNEL